MLSDHCRFDWYVNVPVGSGRCVFAGLDHAKMKQYLCLLQSLTASHKRHMTTSNAEWTYHELCMDS